MLEMIGFIVWLLFTVGLTVLPSILKALSGLSGGLSTGDKIFCVILLLLASWSWINIFERVSINI